MNLAKAKLHVVSDDGVTETTLFGLADMFRGGTDPKAIGLFSDATAAKNEAERRKALRDLRDRLTDLEHEELDAVSEALETIQARPR